MSQDRKDQQGGQPRRPDQQQGGGTNPNQQQQQNPKPNPDVKDRDEGAKDPSRDISGPAH